MYQLVGNIAGKDLNLPLGRGRIRLGRGSRNDIDLEDRSISREHAELVVEEGRIRVLDLGSSNGTWVNGLRIRDMKELQPGDELRFGSRSFQLLSTDAPPPESDTLDTHPEMTLSLLAGKEEVSADIRIDWSDSQDALDLPGVFDQVLLRALTEAGQLMVLPRDLPEIFDEMLGIVERVAPARRILLLLNEEGEELPVIRAARPRGTAREKLVLSHTIIGHVLHERQTCLLNDVNLDPRFSAQDSVIQQNLRSAMVAPLFDNEQVIGLLYADNDDPRFRYNRDQLRAFSLLANLVAVKISNTRLLRARQEQERMEQEVAAAAQVQRTLLASHLPFLPDYQLLARQIPCFEVAGDLYDVTQLPDGRAMLVVGDVTGKGMGAAMLMSSIIAALRVLYQECADLATLAERLHRQILRSSDDIHFATMFLGQLDPFQHQLEYVNAGHNPPLLLCADRGCRSLPSTGLPMGLMPGATYSTRRIDLPVGALLCVFTDGIPEAMVREEFYGEQRLQACIEGMATRPLEEIIDAVVRDLRAFLGEHVLQDDVTMLLLRRQD